ncbi:DUF3617 domain-containing protein [Sphingomonas mollis]|uniref:DUF3617 domain-containing protein n=1 Tax=Sphingomonas mollis TaxID=2795726 RepID=A0ABS0XPE8_9SPHN|nr:DUF3617 domain-containing protein [Sphingomonas sp. BT553]MBJ6121665.1 DUF3617 domain-containing protein [Sphingomonas sp. BT553]
MRAIVPLFALLSLPLSASAQSLQSGNWDLTSTAVDLVVPGAPGFLLRMMRGKSKTEHRCLPPEQSRAGVAALFVPNAEAKCTVERAVIADGRIDHAMSCPQKKGPPMHVVRAGTYNAAGFTARMTMTGQTEKGAMRIVADQVATRTGATCRK